MNLKQSWIPTAVSVVVLIFLFEHSAAVPAITFPGENNNVESERKTSEEAADWGVLTKTLEECAEKDVIECLGVKAITAMSRASRMTNIQVAEGVALIKNPDFDDRRNSRAFFSENDVQNSLNQEPEEKSSRLVEFFMESVARFLTSHNLQFKLRELIPGQVQRALEEARGKKKMLKALLPIILGIGAKLALTIPLGLGLVGFLALKALVVSKIALVLAAILGLQKFFGSGGLGGLNSGKNGWSVGSSPGWSSGGSVGGWNSGGSSGGWSTSGSGAASAGYYRSFDGNSEVDAHQLAYSAQVPQEASK